MNTAFTLTTVLFITLFYTFYNSFTFPETMRYVFDMGYNIGMGDSNIQENDVSLLVTSFWMLIGNVIFFQWCLALVKSSLAIESSGIFHNVAGKTRETVQKMSTRARLPPQVLAIILVVIWTIFGIGIGVLVEEWSLLKSFNFAIGGMTTTGSQLVSNTTLSNILSTVFLAIGVPLFSIVTSVVVLPDFITKDTDNEENIELGAARQKPLNY